MGHGPETCWSINKQHDMAKRVEQNRTVMTRKAEDDASSKEASRSSEDDDDVNIFLEKRKRERSLSNHEHSL